MEFIDRSLRQARKSFYRIDPRPEFTLSNMLILPFNENLLQVPSLLKLFNVNVVFSNNNTVKNIIIKNSPDQYGGCVYKIPCNGCNKYYIGQTGNELTVRVKQHQTSVQTGQVANGVFVHVRDFDHPIDWDQASSILPCKTYVERNIIESSIIKYTNSQNMNISPGMYKLDPFIINAICRQVGI